MGRSALQRLLQPRAIAIVGASDDARSVGGLVVANVERFGYAGAVHLVSRSREQVHGRRCVKTIDELPEGIDAAVLVVPQAAVLASVAACGRRGMGGVVVFASGYAELGEAGRAEQAALAEVARAHGLALLGPNCMGFANLTERVPLTFEPLQLPPAAPHALAPVAVIAQSGAMNGNIRQALHAKGLEVAYAVSTGNEAGLAAEDVLAHLVDHSPVRVFALFVEMIRQPQVFLQAARRARGLGKAIVLMHPGRSARSREAAQSHTGALAGDHALMQAQVEREGVLVVDSMDELFDVTAILARYPQPVPALGTAVASNSGAMRGIALDFCDAIGLPLVPLSDGTLARLTEVLPDFATPDNPLDLTSQGMQQPELFGLCAQALLADPQVGSLVMPLMGGSAAQQLAKAEHLLPAVETSTKPVCVVYMGDQSPLGEAFQARMAQSGIPFFRSPERALRAMAHVHRRGRLLQAAEQAGAPSGPAATEPWRGPLAEYKGKAVLRQLGIDTPRGALARTLEEALAVAADIGWPVVLKAQADALMHKSDVGGVAVNVGDAAALRAAWGRLHASVSAACPGLALDGVLVEALAAPGLELVVGARRDPLWGVVTLVGLGGIWIEALHDARLLPADLSEAQIVAELRQLKGAALLGGLRGQAAVHLPAVAAVVRRLAGLMLAQPHWVEVDINPLMAYPDRVVALDALLVARAGD